MLSNMNWKQVKSRRYCSLKIPFLLLSMIIVLVYLKTRESEDVENDGDVEFDGEANASMEIGEENAFIHNAYFYTNSKSLGQNAVAIVATMHKHAVSSLNDYKLKIVGTNYTQQSVTYATISTEQDPDENCDYTTVLIQTNTLNAISKLEIESNKRFVRIPLTEPKSEAPKPVIFCIAPLFAAEQWQSLLMQLQVTKKFEAHLHIYMMTMVEHYYQLVRELGERGIITAQPWLTPKFSQVSKPFLEPSRNSALRNPAAAFTDCLLQYKEVAEFVGFMEIEDLLFPSNSDTYFYEFEREYKENNQISALYYQVVEQTSVKYSSLNQQSLKALLSNAKSRGTSKRGRSIVRPERCNSTLGYYSTSPVKQYVDIAEQIITPSDSNWKLVSTNAFLSFIELEYASDSTSITVIPDNPLVAKQPLLSSVQLTEIEEGIKQTLILPTIQEYLIRLPTEDYYSIHLKECLKKQNSEGRQCKNTRSCNLPNNNKIPCRHSDGLYHSGGVMKPYTFHFTTEHYFTRNLGCYE